ncbi:MAG: hypothetical protein QMD05_10915, partial [Candidatus Brocadiaceae bacterium]|nr:hypothetical protein [Candidatus Brocadiaceae bacterium]
MTFTDFSTPFCGLSGKYVLEAGAIHAEQVRLGWELPLRERGGHPAHWQDLIDTARGEGVSHILYKSLVGARCNVPLRDSNGLLPKGCLE